MYIVELTRPNSATESFRFANTVDAYNGYNAAKVIAKLRGGYAQLVWDDGGTCAVVASSDED